MKPGTAWLAAIAVLVAAAAFGYRSGMQQPPTADDHESAQSQHRSRSTDDATGSSVTADVASSPEAATRAPALPDELWRLQGETFLAAMPELERHARGGDNKAAAALFNQFNGCVDYTRRSDKEITESANEFYEQQVRTLRKFPTDDSANPEIPRNPPPEEMRDKQIANALDQRAVCDALVPATIDNRLHWARLAIERHDRGTIIRLAGAGHMKPDPASRVRNADRLLELQEIERVEINRVVESGDIDAVERAAISYAGDGAGLLPPDSQRALVLTNTWLLATDKHGWIVESMQKRRDKLATSLDPDAVARAQEEADKLYQRCCAQRIPGG